MDAVLFFFFFYLFISRTRPREFAWQQGAIHSMYFFCFSDGNDKSLCINGVVDGEDCPLKLSG